MIDADALIEKLQAEAKHLQGTLGGMVVYAAIRDLEAAPTVSTEPVRRGYWEYADYDGAESYKCSACRRVTKIPRYVGGYIYNFCPHCGAKMEDEA